MAKTPLTEEEIEVKRKERKAKKAEASLRYYYRNQKTICDKHKAKRAEHGTPDCEKTPERVAKKKATNRVWNQNNKDKVKQHGIKSREKNKDKIAKRKKNYYTKNRETDKQKKRIYYIKNKPRILEQVRLNSLKNFEATKERRSKWQKHNRDSQKASAHRIRANRRNCPGKFTKKDIKTILDRQEGLCVYCKNDIRKSYSIDHWVPLKLGGTNYPRNLQLICKPCNSKKSSKDPNDFEGVFEFFMLTP